MAKDYLQKFVTDPNYFLASLQQDVMTDFVISVSLTKCSRAKKRALEIFLEITKSNIRGFMIIWRS